MTARIKLYKQFFTPKKYSQILINKIPIKDAYKIVDLAIGEGALLIEASKIWPNARLYGNDIDEICCDGIRTNIKNIKCYNQDIFLNSSILDLLKNIGHVDLCIGNPPFDLIEQNQDTKAILSFFSLYEKNKAKYIPAEIIFILQCLRILKKDALLALILPDGFYVNNSLQDFRKFLLSKFSILEIIELPIEIFDKTKAKTHIMILKNTPPVGEFIKLSNSLNFNTSSIHFTDAINRMDYGYYNNIYNKFKYKKLSDLDVEIIRGKAKHDIKNINPSHILHTTNFKTTKIFVSSLNNIGLLSCYKDRVAIPNDIIIPRVGTNILGRVGYVKSGYFVATDCIFIIRVKDKKQQKIIYDTLKSEFGKKWIQSISKGVGARHITLKDIVNMPIPYNGDLK